MFCGKKYTTRKAEARMGITRVSSHSGIRIWSEHLDIHHQGNYFYLYGFIENFVIFTKGTTVLHFMEVTIYKRQNPIIVVDDCRNSTVFQIVDSKHTYPKQYIPTTYINQHVAFAPDPSCVSDKPHHASRLFVMLCSGEQYDVPPPVLPPKQRSKNK